MDSDFIRMFLKPATLTGEFESLIQILHTQRPQVIKLNKDFLYVLYTNLVLLHPLNKLHFLLNENLHIL